MAITITVVLLLKQNSGHDEQRSTAIIIDSDSSMSNLHDSKPLDQPVEIREQRELCRQVHKSTVNRNLEIN
jgi:hypothetical protein